MTPNRRDFISYTKLEPGREEPVRGLGGLVNAIGKGTVRYTIEDDEGNPYVFEIEDTWHVPTAPIRLVNPFDWSSQRNKNGDDIAHADIKCKIMTMEWRDDEGIIRRKTTVVDSRNVGIISSAPGYTRFCA